MEPKFQTSFIPQKPVVSSSGGISSPMGMTRTMNIFTSVSVGIFVVVLVAWGGLFGYQQYVQSQITTVSNQLTAAKNSFDFTSIQNLVAINSRITATKVLLDSHVAVSGLFNLLQSLTVQKVGFSNFSYSKKSGVLTISMSGEAEGYDALAAQANVFAQNSYIQNPTFSDFDLAQNGNVVFKFTATIDSQLVSYKMAMAGVEAKVPPLVNTGAGVVSNATTTSQ